MLQGVRRWLAERLERQIALQAVLITLFTATVLATVAIVATVWLLRAQQADDLRLRAEGVTHSIGEAIGRTIGEVEGLARNTLLSNALVDSHGRLVYLEPFLRGFQITGVAPGSLTLCDFSGEPIASDHASLPAKPFGCHSDLPAFRQVFDQERPAAFVDDRPPQTTVVLMQPVLFPNTKRAEGVLVVHIEPSRFLADAQALSPVSRIELVRGEPAPEAGRLAFTLPLTRDDVITPLGLAVRVSRRVELWGAVLPSLAAYAAVTLCLVGLALPLAWRSGRQLAAPLREIAIAARLIAETGTPGPVALPERSDEVGALSDALRSMLGALGAAQAQLEDQVATRTGELRASLASVVQTERALRESTQLYESLVENLPQFIYRIDPAGRLTFVSRALAAQIGLPPEACLGRTGFDLYPEALARQARADDETVMRTGRAVTSVEEHRDPRTGKVRFVELVRIPIKDAQGVVIGIQGVFWDITDRRNAAILLEVQRDLALAVSDGDSREEVMREILADALRLPELEAGAAYAVTPDGGLELIAHQGLSEGFVGQTQHLPAGAFEAQLARTLSLICSCAEATDQCTDPGLIHHALLEAEGLKALVVLPIVLDQRPLACLQLASRSVSSISGETLTALETLAIQFANALDRLQTQSELAHQRENLQALFDTIDDLLFVLDEQGRVRHCNRAATRITGIPEADLAGRPVLLVHPPNRREEAAAIVVEMMEGQRNHCNLPILCADGSELMVETRVVRGRWDGEPALFGLSRDITARLAAEERLRMAANVFDHSHDGIFITDPQGAILEANAAFTRITGYTRAEVLGRNPRLLKSGRQDGAFYQQMWAHLLRYGQWQGEIWNRRRNGEVFAQLLNVSAVTDGAGRTSHYVAIFVDITLQKQYQEHLEQLAHHDPLTGLPNRTLLADRAQVALAQARRAGTRLAVCFLDLDGFKGVNDTLGHEAGDELLRQLARRLLETVRADDTVARMGGDEFVLLLGGFETAEAWRTALDRILRVVAEPFHIQGREERVSGSIGVTLYPDDAHDPEQLLRHADHAMYQAKQAGKGCYRLYAADDGQGGPLTAPW